MKHSQFSSKRLMAYLNDKLELNKTITSQQQKLESLWMTETDINRTLQLLISEMNRRMNESFGAYQMILHDIMDTNNHHVSEFNSQSITVNKSVIDLRKQFHYLSLSLLDTEKNCAAINREVQKWIRVTCNWYAWRHAYTSHVLFNYGFSYK